MPSLSTVFGASSQPATGGSFRVLVAPFTTYSLRLCASACASAPERSLPLRCPCRQRRAERRPSPGASRGAAGAPMTTHSLRLCVGIRPTALPSFPMPSPATTCRASSQPATRVHAELRWRRSPHTLCAFAPLRAHPPRGTLSLSDAHAGNGMGSVVPARDRRVTRSGGGAVHDALSAPSRARSLYAPSPVRLVGSAEVRMGMARHGAANFRPSEVMVGSTSALTDM